MRPFAGSRRCQMFVPSLAAVTAVLVTIGWPLATRARAAQPVAQTLEANTSENDAGALPRGIVREQPGEGPYVEVPSGYMVPYTETIPGTEVTFEMVPVPGGSFSMGSSADESDREDDEGPQVTIELPPFWIAKCEVTWAEYKLYMATYEPLKAIADLRIFLTYKPTDDAGKKQQADLVAKVRPFPTLFDQTMRNPTTADAFTSPTPLYDSSFTFDLGEEPEQPAVTMTQYAAKQYTKWLSGLTGQTYRLPTEAEWEYAARAGSRTAYCFGDDPDEIDDYAWYFDNADDQMQPVGTKKPNAWGIHDMHGNVAEWVLDQYVADHYAKFQKNPVKAADAVAWPTTEFPRVIRGGSWGDDPEWCRSANRLQSGIDWSDPPDRSWKEEDPQIPQSPWWFTEPWTRQIGFRLFRPLEPMTAEWKLRSWDADCEDVRDAVDGKMEEGRGVTGIADDKLSGAMREVEEYQSEEE